jgi:hypothetical protein
MLVRIVQSLMTIFSYQLAVVNTHKIDPSCSNLNPGETLCLGNKGEDCSDTYVVQPDDTCDGVSAKTGVNSTMLHTNNPQINEQCGNLYVGEVSLRSHVEPWHEAGATVSRTIFPSSGTIE